MYLKFTTSQLNEYNKIINTLTSSSTKIHYAVVIRMIENFSKNCDNRKKLLKKNMWLKLLKFNYIGVREYKTYIVATTEQVDNLITYCNTWLEQYNKWEDELIKESEENKNFRGDKVTVVGFSKLLKRKRIKIHEE
jgi:hypothetical protein